jgi:uncharacterized protein YndB with AHSA1/START domain/DNA-binding transcriptional ArsR family regulator
MQDKAMENDEVFKALADESRRKLLDALFRQDGQTLSDLQNELPNMTRFGCMKHLRVLEEAGLVTSQKSGREKLHYLNPVPIQMVYDRWVSKYSQPWAQALTGLKYSLEANFMSDTHSHVFEVFIRTTPERLWQALTDGNMTRQYYYGSAIQVSDSWQAGANYQYVGGDGNNLLDGKIVEIDPPHQLVTTFRPLFGDNTPETAPVSKVTWQIQPMGAACKLTVTHDELEADSPLTEGIISGWNLILSGLKTLLETGEPLVIQQ